MAQTYDLTTSAGLRDYLVHQGVSDTLEVNTLSGGTANYVYRVTFSDGSSQVYKHAAPYSHSNRNFALDARRMDYEARILELQPAASLTRARCAVHAVRLLGYDTEKKLLCISDGGTRTLKAAYDDAEVDVCAIGEALAHWLAALHCNSRDISLALPSPIEPQRQGNGENNPVALHLYRHAYDNLHVALLEFGHDRELATRINEEYGALIARDDECICHGDFWPGNILVRQGVAEDALRELTVVDWELVRRGTSATDVGQFAAEAFLLGRFKGGRGMLAAFLASYVNARDGRVDRAWLKRMVVHWAVHVAYWPTRVAWTDREGTQTLVDMSVGVLEGAVVGDWKKILDSGLLRDVKGLCEGILAGE